MFTVVDSHGDTHEDRFFLKVTKIKGVNYPRVGSGLSSADGPDGGYNKSCYVENGTLTSVAVRFWLSSRRDQRPDLKLNELIWATVGLTTKVELPQDCHATAKFAKVRENDLGTGSHE